MAQFTVYAYKSNECSSPITAKEESRNWEIGCFTADKPLVLGDVRGSEIHNNDMSVFNAIIDAGQGMADMFGELDCVAFFVTDENDDILFYEKDAEWFGMCRYCGELCEANPDCACDGFSGDVDGLYSNQLETGN